MRISFTGTRRGMTHEQTSSLRGLLSVSSAELLVHGDCVGADEQAHELATSLSIRTRARPSDSGAHRAHCVADEIADPRPPLDRNRDIVDDGDFLIAAPGQASEIARSGTWTTIRYARKIGRRVLVIWPDGSVAE